MADEEQDPLAFIIENCRISSSQEELLSIAKFAREDEIFPEDEELEAMERSRRKFDGADDSGVKFGGKLAAGAPNRGTPKNLGFRGERKGESSGTKLEGVSGVKREIEVQLKGKEKENDPQLKKSRVSPLVHISGKMVIKGENGDEAGDLKVSAAPGCTEKMSIEDDDVQFVGESRTGYRAKKKKLGIDLNIEAINVEEDEEIGEMGNVGKEAGQGSGKAEDNEKKLVDGEKTTKEYEEGMIKKRGKRELPRSMFVVWGEGTGDVFNTKKNVEGGSKEANVEGEKDGSKGANVEGAKDGSKEANVEVSRGKKSKRSDEEEAMKCILYALRKLAKEKCSVEEDDDDDEEEEEEEEVDIFETAKRCGMTFPRSRFLPEVEEDDE